MKYAQAAGKVLFLTVNLSALLLLSGCLGGFSSMGQMQYKKLPIEEMAGDVFTQEINNLTVSAVRRFDLSFGGYSNNVLPVYITILNKGKHSYKITDGGNDEYVVPSISIVRKYTDSPKDTVDVDDFYSLESCSLCEGFLKSIEMTKGYGFDMDKAGIAQEACNEEIPFKRIIYPGSKLEGFVFFNAQVFENLDEEISALRLKLEMKNMATEKTDVFLIPLGEGFNCKERFKKIKNTAFGAPLSGPGLRKPAWVEEEIKLGFGELWPKVKKSLFEMKDVQYLSQDTDNREFGFNLPLSKAELESTVSADLRKFHREYLKNARSYVRIRLKESGIGKTKIDISSVIIMGWCRLNSNGKLEKDFLGKLKTSLGLKKYEWLEE